MTRPFLHNDDNTLHSWLEYKKLVLAELERLDRTISKYSEKYEKGLEDVKAAVTELRIEMLSAITELQTSVETAHAEKYMKLEQRVAANEQTISNMLGKAAGISFAIGLFVSLIGIVVTYFSVK